MSKADFALEEFHPSLPGFEENPYPFFDRLREAGPVVRVPRLNTHWAVGHAEVSRIFTDPAFGLTPHPAPEPQPGALAPHMLMTDPPTHTRLRSLVNKAFTPRTVERLRPHVVEIVNSLLDGAGQDGRLDVVEDLAFPLPATVIAELLGVPLEDQQQFRTWSNQIVRAMDAGSSEADRAAGPAANQALAQYFVDLVGKRKQSPQIDMISELIAAEETGDRLSYGEIISTCILLLIAGHETTTGLITNGMLALLRHPDQWEKLCSNPHLLDSAIEELLRYDPPVQRMSRIAQRDTELGGIPFKQGQTVLAVIGAANRDPAVFTDPHRLDITRDPNPHVSFGKGIHYCLGAPLARLEAEIAFSELVRRFPTMQLDPERPPVWSGNTRFRSLKSFPVKLG